MRSPPRTRTARQRHRSDSATKQYVQCNVSTENVKLNRLIFFNARAKSVKTNESGHGRTTHSTLLDISSFNYHGRASLLPPSSNMSAEHTKSVLSDPYAWAKGIALRSSRKTDATRRARIRAWLQAERNEPPARDRIRYFPARAR